MSNYRPSHERSLRHRALRWVSARTLTGPAGSSRRPKGFLGVTLMELVVTTAIVMVLVSVAVPVVSTTVRREKEIELRRALRTIRTAIDEYRRTVGENGQLRSFEKTGSEGYPPDLDTLVKGLDTGELKERKLKFMRRLPVDPFTGKSDWIVRSNQQEHDATVWDRTHVFDVRSSCPGTAADGSKYSDW